MIGNTGGTPDFIIESALVGMRKFVEGGAAGNVLVTTLPERLAAVEELDEASRARLLQQAEDIVRDQVIPGYEGIIVLFEDMALTANHDAGIWRLPGGDAIYRDRLRSSTSTDYSPMKSTTPVSTRWPGSPLKCTPSWTSRVFRKGHSQNVCRW